MAWLVTEGPALLYCGLFGVGFVLLSLAIGRRCLLWLGVRSVHAVSERGALAFTLGASALQLVPLALGALGVLSTRHVCIVGSVLALPFAKDVRSVLLCARATLKQARRPEGWWLAWLVTLLPGLLIALLSALTPTVDPDGLGYHLTVPKRWLTLGSLEYLPTYPYSNTPMGVEMLFTLAMSFAGDAAAKLVHYLMGVAAAVSLFCAARRLASDALSALAVTLLLFGPFGIAPLMGWAYVEAATAAALVGAASAWLVWYQERDVGCLRLAGALAGAGVSYKLTAGLFPVALAALTVVLMWHEARERGEPLGPKLGMVLRVAPLVVLPVLPWMVRSTLVTGNPVFPMFAQLLPSRDFTPEQAAQFEQYNRYMTWGAGSGTGWGLGLRKAILGGAAGALALGGLLVFVRVRSFAARATTAVVVLTLLLQLGAAGLYKRYWIPVLAVMQLPVLLLFLTWLKQVWARPAVIVLSALLSLLTGRQLLRSVNDDAAGLVQTALGLKPQVEFLRGQLPLLPLYQRINSELPAEAGVMLASYCGAFHIDRRTFCVDLVQNSLRVSSWADYVNDLRRLRVTHMLAPRDWGVAQAPRPEPQPLRVGNTSFLVRTKEEELVGRTIRDHSRLLLAASDQGLYAIDLAGLD
ncbi:MAG TPA: hypothetical protein VJN18_28845 [Polyangiaceae bacterium]|nr:hypothetical protein [Polyangiaceae bacterium]